MAYKISWTENALQDYKYVIDYLLCDWSLKVATNFENIVNQKLFNLSMHPFAGIKSEKNPLLRSILFTKHNRLYYRITDNNIELLAIIDTRKNPSQNPF
jgi:plasmid stabilization system protein ParE